MILLFILSHFNMEKQADNGTTISPQKYRTLSENWKECFMKLSYFQQKNNIQSVTSSGNWRE